MPQDASAAARGMALRASGDAYASLRALYGEFSLISRHEAEMAISLKEREL